MTDDSDPHMFLMFFLSLAGCSLVSLPVTWLVNDSRRGLAQLTLTSSDQSEISLASSDQSELSLASSDQSELSLTSYDQSELSPLA